MSRWAGLVVSFLFITACGDSSSSDNKGSGGSAGDDTSETGGSVGDGGTTAQSGGSSASGTPGTTGGKSSTSGGKGSANGGTATTSGGKAGGTGTSGATASGGTSVGTGGAGPATGGASATGGGTVTPPDASFLPADRRSTWRPGIPGGIPTVTTIHTTINASMYGNGTTNATTAINAAIQAAGEVGESTGKPQVVMLPKGTYRLNGTINMDRSNVVLRGAGPKDTKLLLYGSGPVIQSGWPSWPQSAVNITGTVAVGATSITVASASSFKVGDIIQIDQVDDPSYVYIYDAWYDKRAPDWDNNGPVSSGGYRSVTSLHEVTAISGTTVSFDPPTRIQYDAARTPQAWKVTGNTPATSLRGMGIEDLYVTGGDTDSIGLEAPVYSWVSNVESDGSTTTGRGNSGAHIRISHGFRCEIQHVYVHHAREITEGGGAYGICLNASTSDTLVQDSIAVYLNKAMQTNVSGGGNVFGYNYIDNIRGSSASWMEGAANGSHQSFSHHDLWEGNYTANMGSDTTHGSSGFLVYFRNFAAGRCGDAAYFAAQNSNLRAVNADGWMRETTFVGNVLQAPTIGSQAPAYEVKAHNDPSRAGVIWRIGQNVQGDGSSWDSETMTPPPNESPPSGPAAPNPTSTYNTKAFAKLWRHGNWDNVNKSIPDWQTGYEQTLPNSLYLSSKPAFFGANAWPWVDPKTATVAAPVQTLPAKQRYDAM